jgi:hypothetical protein
VRPFGRRHWRCCRNGPSGSASSQHGVALRAPLAAVMPRAFFKAELRSPIGAACAPRGPAAANGSRAAGRVVSPVRGTSPCVTIVGRSPRWAATSGEGRRSPRWQGVVGKIGCGAPAPGRRCRRTVIPRFPELREVAGASDFDGVVSFGRGLSAESGFRVFTLTDPDRFVVDVRIVTLAATGSTIGPMILTAWILVWPGP